MKSKLKTPAALKRLLSFWILIVFLISNTFPYPVYGASPAVEASLKISPENLAAIQIPQNIGKIQEFHQGKSSQVVVLVQDAHAIPDAQRSIQKIIEHFQKEYGVGLIALEGASEELDARIFRSFPDKGILKRVFEEYFEKGELSGSVAAAIFSNVGGGKPAFFKGVEDWPLYEEGIGLYLKASKEEGSYGAKIAELKKEIQKKKAEVYSKELLDLDRSLESFHARHENLAAVLKKFAAIRLPEKGTELALLVEEILREGEDKKLLESEVEGLAKKMQTLLKKGRKDIKAFDRNAFNQKYQEFQTSQIAPEAFALFLKEIAAKQNLPLRFSPYVEELIHKQKQMRNIEGTEIFREFEVYSRSVKESLFRSDEERKLDQSSHELELLERFARLELSREDWNELNALSLRAPEGRSNLRENLKSHFNFYRNAQKRESALFGNLLSLMKQKKSNASIFVAGGFHTEGLTRLLKEQGISYLLLMPQIKSLPETDYYREHMNGNVSWKNYLKAENGKINLYQAFVRATRDKLLTGHSSLLKIWRDQIIRDLAVERRAAAAHDYTAFIDEVSKNKRADQFLAPWQIKVDRFLKNLRRLEENHQLTEQNVLKILNPSMAIGLLDVAPFQRRLFVPDDLIGLDSRSETRMESENPYLNKDLIPKHKQAFLEAIHRLERELFDKKGITFDQNPSVKDLAEVIQPPSSGLELVYAKAFFNMGKVLGIWEIAEAEKGDDAGATIKIQKVNRNILPSLTDSEEVMADETVQGMRAGIHRIKQILEHRAKGGKPIVLTLLGGNDKTSEKLAREISTSGIPGIPSIVVMPGAEFVARGGIRDGGGENFFFFSSQPDSYFIPRTSFAEYPENWLDFNGFQGRLAQALSFHSLVILTGVPSEVLLRNSDVSPLRVRILSSSKRSELLGYLQNAIDISKADLMITENFPTDEEGISRSETRTPLPLKFDTIKALETELKERGVDEEVFTAVLSTVVASLSKPLNISIVLTPRGNSEQTILIYDRKNGDLWLLPFNPFDNTGRMVGNNTKKLMNVGKVPNIGAFNLILENGWKPYVLAFNYDKKQVFYFEIPMGKGSKKPYNLSWNIGPISDNTPPYKLRLDDRYVSVGGKSYSVYGELYDGRIDDSPVLTGSSDDYKGQNPYHQPTFPPDPKEKTAYYSFLPDGELAAGVGGRAQVLTDAQLTEAKQQLAPFLNKIGFSEEQLVSHLGGDLDGWTLEGFYVEGDITQGIFETEDLPFKWKVKDWHLLFREKETVTPQLEQRGEKLSVLGRTEYVYLVDQNGKTQHVDLGSNLLTTHYRIFSIHDQADLQFLANLKNPYNAKELNRSETRTMRRTASALILLFGAGITAAVALPLHAGLTKFLNIEPNGLLSDAVLVITSTSTIGGLILLGRYLTRRRPDKDFPPDNSRSETRATKQRRIVTEKDFLKRNRNILNAALSDFLQFSASGNDEWKYSFSDLPQFVASGYKSKSSRYQTAIETFLRLRVKGAIPFLIEQINLLISHTEIYGYDKENKDDVKRNEDFKKIKSMLELLFVEEGHVPYVSWSGIVGNPMAFLLLDEELETLVEELENQKITRVNEDKLLEANRPVFSTAIFNLSKFLHWSNGGEFISYPWNAHSEALETFLSSKDKPGLYRDAIMTFFRLRNEGAIPYLIEQITYFQRGTDSRMLYKTFAILNLLRSETRTDKKKLSTLDELVAYMDSRRDFSTYDGTRRYYPTGEPEVSEEHPYREWLKAERPVLTYHNLKLKDDNDRRFGDLEFYTESSGTAASKQIFQFNFILYPETGKRNNALSIEIFDSKEGPRTDKETSFDLEVDSFEVPLDPSLPLHLVFNVPSVPQGLAEIFRSAGLDMGHFDLKVQGMEEAAGESSEFVSTDITVSIVEQGQRSETRANADKKVPVQVISLPSKRELMRLLANRYSAGKMFNFYGSSMEWKSKGRTIAIKQGSYTDDIPYLFLSISLQGKRVLTGRGRSEEEKTVFDSYVDEGSPYGEGGSGSVSFNSPETNVSFGVKNLQKAIYLVVTASELGIPSSAGNIEILFLDTHSRSLKHSRVLRVAEDLFQYHNGQKSYHLKKQKNVRFVVFANLSKYASSAPDQTPESRRYYALIKVLKPLIPRSEVKSETRTGKKDSDIDKALIDVVRLGQNVRDRVAAIEALGNRNVRAVVPVLHRILSDYSNRNKEETGPNQRAVKLKLPLGAEEENQLIKASLEALGKIMDRRSIPYLINFAKVVQPVLDWYELKLKVLAILADFRDIRAAGVFAVFVEDLTGSISRRTEEEDKVLGNIAGAFYAMKSSPEIIDIIINFLRSPVSQWETQSKDLLSVAVRILADSGDPRTEQIFRNILRSTSDYRLKGGDSLFPGLYNMVLDALSGVRTLAAEKLLKDVVVSASKPKQGRSSVTKNLSDEKRWNAGFDSAEILLKDFKSHEAERIAIRFAISSSIVHSESVRSLLVRHGRAEAAIPELVGLFRTSGIQGMHFYQNIRFAVKTLHDFNWQPEGVIPELLKLLRSPQWEIRQFAAETIRDFKLEPKDGQDRIHYFFGLGSWKNLVMAGPSALPLLRKALRDSNENISLGAARAILEMATGSKTEGADESAGPQLAAGGQAKSEVRAGRTDIPAKSQLSPQFSPRNYGYVETSEGVPAGQEYDRVQRPSDHFTDYAEEHSPKIAIFPSSLIASSKKLSRDIRRAGELEVNVPQFRNLLGKTLLHLLNKKARSPEEDKILSYFQLIQSVFQTTGFSGPFLDQMQQARDLSILEQTEIQLKVEEGVKAYFTQPTQQDLISYFMPHFARNFKEAIVDLAKAQGFYGENAMLAAYYRAFQLLVGITFPLDPPGKQNFGGQKPALSPKESLKLGLTFFRVLYQSGAYEEIAKEQDYLSDVGPENYAANLTRILRENDSILIEAIQGSGDLTDFINAHFDHLVEKLASEPRVGKTEAGMALNIDGIPVVFFEGGRPSGFTPLTQIGSMDAKIIQNVGAQKVRALMEKIKLERNLEAADIPKLIEAGAANLNWVTDLAEAMADKPMAHLTPAEVLLKAEGVALKTARDHFSEGAYDLYRLLAASDYLLDAEQTVKARQRAIVYEETVAMASFGDFESVDVRRDPDMVYVPMLPDVYSLLGLAAAKEGKHLKKYFGRIPTGIPSARKITANLEALQELQEVFQTLTAETRGWEAATQGRKDREQLVPIENRDLVKRLYENWLRRGRIANAKPVTFPAMTFGIHDIDSGVHYEGQVMFAVGGPLEGTVRTMDGQDANFAAYHLWRMVNDGGETITTAEHTNLINEPRNAGAFQTDQGIAELYKVRLAETYNPGNILSVSRSEAKSETRSADQMLQRNAQVFAHRKGYAASTTGKQVWQGVHSRLSAVQSEDDVPIGPREWREFLRPILEALNIPDWLDTYLSEVVQEAKLQHVQAAIKALRFIRGKAQRAGQNEILSQAGQFLSVLTGDDSAGHDYSEIDDATIETVRRFIDDQWWKGLYQEKGVYPPIARTILGKLIPPGKPSGSNDLDLPFVSFRQDGPNSQLDPHEEVILIQTMGTPRGIYDRLGVQILFPRTGLAYWAIPELDSTLSGFQAIPPLEYLTHGHRHLDGNQDLWFRENFDTLFADVVVRPENQDGLLSFVSNFSSSHGIPIQNILRLKITGQVGLDLTDSDWEQKARERRVDSSDEITLFYRPYQGPLTIQLAPEPHKGALAPEGDDLQKLQRGQYYEFITDGSGMQRAIYYRIAENTNLGNVLQAVREATRYFSARLVSTEIGSEDPRRREEIFHRAQEFQQSQQPHKLMPLFSGDIAIFEFNISLRQTEEPWFSENPPLVVRSETRMPGWQMMIGLAFIGGLWIGQGGIAEAQNIKNLNAEISYVQFGLDFNTGELARLVKEGKLIRQAKSETRSLYDEAMNAFTQRLESLEQRINAFLRHTQSLSFYRIYLTALGHLDIRHSDTKAQLAVFGTMGEGAIIDISKLYPTSLVSHVLNSYLRPPSQKWEGEVRPHVFLVPFWVPRAAFQNIFAAVEDALSDQANFFFEENPTWKKIVGKYNAEQNRVAVDIWDDAGKTVIDLIDWRKPGDETHSGLPKLVRAREETNNELVQQLNLAFTALGYNSDHIIAFPSRDPKVIEFRYNDPEFERIPSRFNLTTDLEALENFLERALNLSESPLERSSRSEARIKLKVLVGELASVNVKGEPEVIDYSSDNGQTFAARLEKLAMQSHYAAIAVAMSASVRDDLIREPFRSKQLKVLEWFILPAKPAQRKKEILSILSFIHDGRAKQKTRRLGSLPTHYQIDKNVEFRVDEGKSVPRDLKTGVHSMLLISPANLGPEPVPEAAKKGGRGPKGDTGGLPSKRPKFPPGKSGSEAKSVPPPSEEIETGSSSVEEGIREGLRPVSRSGSSSSPRSETRLTVEESPVEPKGILGPQGDELSRLQRGQYYHFETDATGLLQTIYYRVAETPILGQVISAIRQATGYRSSKIVGTEVGAEDPERKAEIERQFEEIKQSPSLLPLQPGDLVLLKFNTSLFESASVETASSSRSETRTLKPQIGVEILQYEELFQAPEPKENVLPLIVDGLARLADRYNDVQAVGITEAKDIMRNGMPDPEDLKDKIAWWPGGDLSEVKKYLQQNYPSDQGYSYGILTLNFTGEHYETGYEFGRMITIIPIRRTWKRFVGVGAFDSRDVLMDLVKHQPVGSEDTGYPKVNVRYDEQGDKFIFNNELELRFGPKGPWARPIYISHLQGSLIYTVNEYLLGIGEGWPESNGSGEVYSPIGLVFWRSPKQALEKRTIKFSPAIRIEEASGPIFGFETPSDFIESPQRRNYLFRTGQIRSGRIRSEARMQEGPFVGFDGFYPPVVLDRLDYRVVKRDKEPATYVFKRELYIRFQAPVYDDKGNPEISRLTMEIWKKDEEDNKVVLNINSLRGIGNGDIDKIILYFDKSAVEQLNAKGIQSGGKVQIEVSSPIGTSNQRQSEMIQNNPPLVKKQRPGDKVKQARTVRKAAKAVQELEKASLSRQRVNVTKPMKQHGILYITETIREFANDFDGRFNPTPEIRNGFNVQSLAVRDQMIKFALEQSRQNVPLAYGLLKFLTGQIMQAPKNTAYHKAIYQRYLDLLRIANVSVKRTGQTGAHNRKLEILIRAPEKSNLKWESLISITDIGNKSFGQVNSEIVEELRRIRKNGFIQEIVPITFNSGTIQFGPKEESRALKVTNDDNQLEQLLSMSLHTLGRSEARKDENELTPSLLTSPVEIEAQEHFDFRYRGSFEVSPRGKQTLQFSYDSAARLFGFTVKGTPHNQGVVKTQSYQIEIVPGDEEPVVRVTNLNKKDEGEASSGKNVTVWPVTSPILTPGPSSDTLADAALELKDITDSSSSASPLPPAAEQEEQKSESQVMTEALAPLRAVMERARVIADNTWNVDHANIYYDITHTAFDLMLRLKQSGSVDDAKSAVEIFLEKQIDMPAGMNQKAAVRTLKEVVANPPPAVPQSRSEARKKTKDQLLDSKEKELTQHGVGTRNVYQGESLHFEKGEERELELFDGNNPKPLTTVSLRSQKERDAVWAKIKEFGRVERVMSHYFLFTKMNLLRVVNGKVKVLNFQGDWLGPSSVDLVLDDQQRGYGAYSEMRVRRAANIVARSFMGEALATRSEAREIANAGFRGFEGPLRQAEKRFAREDLIKAGRGFDSVTRGINQPVMLHDQPSEDQFRVMGADDVETWVSYARGAVNSNKYVTVRLPNYAVAGSNRKVADLVASQKTNKNDPVEWKPVPGSDDIVLYHKDRPGGVSFAEEPTLVIRSESRNDGTSRLDPHKYFTGAAVSSKDRPGFIMAGLLLIADSLHKQIPDFIARSEARDGAGFVYHLRNADSLSRLSQLGNLLVFRRATASAA